MATAVGFNRLLDEDLFLPGILGKCFEADKGWFRGEKLDPYDADRYGIAIDVSGNVSPCLVFSFMGSFVETWPSRILEWIDRDAIETERL